MQIKSLQWTYQCSLSQRTIGCHPCNQCTTMRKPFANRRCYYHRHRYEFFQLLIASLLIIHNLNLVASSKAEKANLENGDAVQGDQEAPASVRDLVSMLQVWSLASQLFFFRSSNTLHFEGHLSPLYSTQEDIVASPVAQFLTAVLQTVNSVSQGQSL